MRCSVDDHECTPGRLRKGMCSRHYGRMRHHGHTGSGFLDHAERLVVGPGPLTTACLLWGGPAYPNGYGKLSRPWHGTRLAHRAFYIEHVGPIPHGLELDHLCRIRLCIRHTEPVSRSVNITRGWEATGLCKNGLHDLTLPDAYYVETSGVRSCNRCRLARFKRARSH